jgi:hypothetical protein
VGERLTPEDFNNLFGRFQQEAFRLEVQPVYALDYEREAFDAFLRGESHPATDYDWYRPWLDQIRKATGQGRRVARVRVLAEPPTNYQRFELHMARWNIAAGETLRCMPRAKAAKAGLPLADDWWLFDSRRVAVMRFDPDGTAHGGEIFDDPDTVSRYCTWRDLAVHHSTPFMGFAAA